MQIVSDNLGPDFQNAFQMSNDFFEELVACRIFQIANVLAEKGMLTFCETDGIFQFATHRENSWKLLLQKNWNGNESTRASQLPQRTAHNAHHRIVAAQEDVAVVH